MTQDERIDQLEARLLAYGIVLQFLLQDAPQETRDALVRGAKAAVERGLALPLTDLQIDQLQQLLLSMRQ